MQKIFFAAVILATIFGGSEGSARSRNIIPLGWIAKSLLECESTSDHMCKIKNYAGEEYSIVPIFTLPNAKAPVAFIQAGVASVKNLDEKGAWVFVGYMVGPEDPSDCYAQSNEQNIVSLFCANAPRE